MQKSLSIFQIFNFFSTYPDLKVLTLGVRVQTLKLHHCFRHHCCYLRIHGYFLRQRKHFPPRSLSQWLSCHIDKNNFHIVRKEDNDFTRMHLEIREILKLLARKNSHSRITKILFCNACLSASVLCSIFLDCFAWILLH